MTRFSKQKLAKAQEKKAKSVTVSGLLSKKKAGDVIKKDPVIMPSPTHSPAKRPDSLVEDDSALKAHKALSVDDLGLLMAKSFNKVMSSHIHKLVQNETLKNKVAILTAEAENDKECVATLEKSLQVEKDFYKLKDKQIGDLELKLQNVEATVVQDFTDSNKYFDDLCKYYVEGFDLHVKWIAKHHPGLDLSGLVVDDVEKEFMSDRPFEATVENVMEEATDAAEVMKEASVPNE
nr:hypothetical protein CFP56_47303 [Quercus suber]